MARQYFTKDNFEEFLRWLNGEKNREGEKYGEPKWLKVKNTHTGLILKKFDINISELEQGTYYYSETPIRELTIKNIKQYNNIGVMGETIVYFTTANEITSDAINIPNVYWGSNCKLEINSTYQLRIINDNLHDEEKSIQNKIFAFLTKYGNTFEENETIDFGKKYIKVSYTTDSKYSFKTFTKKWLEQISNKIETIYVALDGHNYNTINANQLISNNTLIATGPNIYPSIVVKFREGDNINIKFDDAFNNINIRTFEMSMDANQIESMKNMFAYETGSNLTDKIDLTGIRNSDNILVGRDGFVGLFDGRKCNNYILFGEDAGTSTGINTKNATSLLNMFANSYLNDNNINSIIENLDVSNCNDFSGLFFGNNITNINKTFKIDYVNSVMNKKNQNNDLQNNGLTFNFSAMFQSTNINDLSYNYIIDNIIKKIIAFGNNDLDRNSVTEYNLSRMFKKCNNLKLLGSNFDLNLFLTDKNLQYINMSEMFSECSQLYNVPKLYFSYIVHPELKHINLSEMFQNSGTSSQELSFSTVGEWDFTYPENGPQLILTRLFNGVPLYKISSKRFNFCKPNSKIISYEGDESIKHMFLSEMFNNITRGNNCQINFYLYFGEAKSNDYMYNNCINIFGQGENQGPFYIYNPKLNSSSSESVLFKIVTSYYKENPRFANDIIKEF